MTFTLINASAGSGKTYTLTHRIADEVRAGLQPSQLIATTFTKKAAAELSDRVRRTLLEEGMLEQARATDSALIGTVNSVFGRLLQEFALDAGISPEVRALDEEQQKSAFTAAIAETAAAAGGPASDLLARTEQDGPDDPEPNRGEKPSWRLAVRRLAEAARTNLIGAQELREAAEQSWQELRDTALPEPGEDLRAGWISRLDLALAELRGAIADAENPDVASTMTKTELTGIASAAKKLPGLEQLRRTLDRAERAPWSEWTRIAKIAEAKLGSGVKTSYEYGQVIDHALISLAQDVQDSLLALPALQADIRTLIELVMGTAADSLDAYARYKRDLGLIDFIDQEVGALELLRGSERVREVVRSRFRLLAVDEFQDTSPVQLALFLELSLLIEDKVWVGDPKQAIYGFRDADPSLMLGIIEQLEAGTTALGSGRIENLEHSWRSQDEVLALVSEVFPRVFTDSPRERVVLGAAPAARARRAEAGHEPGRLEAWTTPPQLFKNGNRKPPTVAERTVAVADGIAELLAEPGTRPGDIAVLVRKNSDRSAVVDALAARGIPASGEGVPVLASREGRIVRAGLAVALDRRDTLALTELVDLLPDHRAHGQWFQQLAAAADRAGREEVFESWWRDPALDELRALREECLALTPVEMITALVDAVDLPERIRAWSDPEQRLRTLDALRRVAADYADRARAASAPITLTGLRGELDALDRGPDLEGLPDTVWVGTIHNAKGLEWSRVVVLFEPDPKERSQTSGSFIVPAPRLDVTQPLAGRSARYWPAVLPRFAPLQDTLGEAEHARRRAVAEREESGRLQYVALTRAKDITVLAGDGRAPVLDALVAPARGTSDEDPEPLLSWEGGASRIRVAGGADLPARIRTLRTLAPADESYDSGRSRLAASDLPPGRRLSATVTSARFQASSVASGQELGDVLAPVRIGAPLVEHGGQGWERVGEAVHGYLALPLRALDASQRELAAHSLVQRWSVERGLGTEALLGAGQAWLDHLDAHFPGSEQLTEQPITWWNEDAQVMEGWIDTLLRRPDGAIVLVDHKSYPGDDPVGHVRREYLGQMSTYSQALTAAGMTPDRILMHLPLRGEVIEVRLHEHAR
ncbi:UvrD-helicase domain-containing protein [Brachybacterium sacelli]|uniref:DNA 3'-5' helicase n=1 Tax=Brachybacterium sacelli TaxID=173364 RepID=A0ABS4WZV7_9MICO|nr:UvrD-helicase domain-containing protein [Brachybacterium sacelli]MBP2381661.1 ATP-dependent exoDNAse (exonuclease V) beta subunit [Brachybacterium sacelli]